MMATISALTAHLDTLLNNAAFQDSSRNGVQVDGGDRETTRVAVAVDAGLAVIERAIAAGAHLLIVHHGILWGVEQPISGPFGRKVSALIRAGVTLYASHLPLDAHPEVGNNAELARAIELTDLAPYMPYKGACIGVRGRCESPRPLDWFVARAGTLSGARSSLTLPFGPPTIRTVGVVTGSGSLALEESARLGLDLLVTGEPKQSAYHEAKELGINVLFAGHYATETFGVRALGERLRGAFGIEPLFIDEPTGI
jgi:dinuclear metal center YbgI/SA1388 family protein